MLEFVLKNLMEYRTLSCNETQYCIADTYSYGDISHLEWKEQPFAEVLGIKDLAIENDELRKNWKVLASRLGITRLNVRKLQLLAWWNDYTQREILKHLLILWKKQDPTNFLVGVLLHHLHELNCKYVANIFQKNCLDYYYKHVDRKNHVPLGKQEFVEGNTKLRRRSSNQHDITTSVNILKNLFSTICNNLLEEAKEIFWDRLPSSIQSEYCSLDSLFISTSAVKEAIQKAQMIEATFSSDVLREIARNTGLSQAYLPLSQYEHQSLGAQWQVRHDIQQDELSHFVEQNTTVNKKKSIIPCVQKLWMPVQVFVLVLVLGSLIILHKSGKLFWNETGLPNYSISQLAENSSLVYSSSLEPSENLAYRVHSLAEFNNIKQHKNIDSVIILMHDQSAWQGVIGFDMTSFRELKIIGLFSVSILVKLLEISPILQSLEIAYPQRKSCSPFVPEEYIFTERLPLINLKHISFRNISECDALYRRLSMEVSMKNLQTFKIEHGVLTSNNINPIKDMVTHSRSALKGLLFPRTVWRVSWFTGKSITFLKVSEVYIDFMESKINYIPIYFYNAFPNLKILYSENGNLDWDQFENLYYSKTLHSFSLRLHVPDQVKTVNVLEILEKFSSLQAAYLFLEFGYQATNSECTVEGFNEVKRLVPNFTLESNCRSKTERNIISTMEKTSKNHVYIP